MSKKTKIERKDNIFDHLTGNNKKKKQLREVLKKFDRSLEDYKSLWKKDRFL